MKTTHPRWGLPPKVLALLESAQAVPGLEPTRVSMPPFVASVQLPAPTGPLRVTIQLRFSEAADPDRRQASFEYVAELSAEQRSQPASAAQNGTAGDVQRKQVKSAASPAAGYSTRSTARIDKDVLACDQSEVVRFVTQRQDYSLPKAECAVDLDMRQGDERTDRSKRQRR